VLRRESHDARPMRIDNWATLREQCIPRSRRIAAKASSNCSGRSTRAKTGGISAAAAPRRCDSHISLLPMKGTRAIAGASSLRKLKSFPEKVPAGRDFHAGKVPTGSREARYKSVGDRIAVEQNDDWNCLCCLRLACPLGTHVRRRSGSTLLHRPRRRILTCARGMRAAAGRS
jgi:hypothetical protein